MGQTSLETVREIEETREKLEGKLLALEERMPALTPVKRLVGVAVGGGMGGSLFWFVVKRIRRRKKNEAQPVNAVINLVPENIAEKLQNAMEDERAKQYAIGLLALWLLLKLAEIRQLRALRRAQMA